MHQGNWKCSGCGGVITELPFQPRSEAGLTCRSCYGKQKGGTSSSNYSKGSSDQPDPSPDLPAASEIPDDIPMDAGFASEAPPFEGFEGATDAVPGEKKKFDGDWSCAGCGTAITSLPFNPRDTSGLKCIDCFKQSKS